VSDEHYGDGDPLTLLPDFHRSTRMPLDAVVRLHFEGTVAYQNGFAANVSALGMFVKHPEPPAIDTRLVFEFVLGEERKPVQGAGVVAWTRERYEGPGRPAGVGIRFSELDALSRQHIAEALFEYLEAQLGVDVADHPDVPDLLAAVPSSSEVEIPPPAEGEQLTFDAASNDSPEPSAPVEEPVTRPGLEEEVTRPGTEPGTFTLFDDRAGSDISGEVETLDERSPELFEPSVPPDPSPFSTERDSSAAGDTSRGPWTAVAIAVAVIAAALAVWWLWLGPGSLGNAPESAADEPVAAAPPPRPALDPSPGPERTLAESVGAEAPEAPAAEPEAAAVEPPTSGSAGETAPAPPARRQERGPTLGPPPGAAPATRVTDITWDTAGGGTVVTLGGDGAFESGRYRWFEMRGENPRVLVRLAGIEASYPRTSIDVGSEELTAIRVGFHQKPDGSELHVVLDLARPDVRVESVSPENGALVVRLSLP